MGQTDTLFARFWSQTIRWLAGRDLEQQRSLLTVNTDRPVRSGERRSGIHAEFASLNRERPRPPTLSSKSLAESGKNAKPVSLRSSSARADVFFSSFALGSGEDTEVQASLQGAGGRHRQPDDRFPGARPRQAGRHGYQPTAIDRGPDGRGIRRHRTRPGEIAEAHPAKRAAAHAGRKIPNFGILWSIPCFSSPPSRSNGSPAGGNALMAK